MKFLKRAGLAACAVLFGLCGCMGGGADNGGDGDVEILSVAFTASEEVMDITETTTLKMYMEAMAGNYYFIYGNTLFMVLLFLIHNFAEGASVHAGIIGKLCIHQDIFYSVRPWKQIAVIFCYLQHFCRNGKVLQLFFLFIYG